MVKKVDNTSKNPHIEWLFGLNPNAIYDQESQGQQQLNSSDQLPKKCNSPRGIDIKKQYELMGIEVLSDSDGNDLFLDVRMPEGWQKQSTDHSMWNNLIDDKGRIRGMYFYKAAFYDRDSFMNFKTRYSVDGDYSERGSTTYFVWDADKKERIFSTERLVEDYNDKSYFKKQDELQKRCKDFLKNNFPNHEDINAYWS